jgi:hypothetical protein
MRRSAGTVLALAASMSTARTAPSSPAGSSPVARRLSLIQAEYREMPGLCLTRQQAARLWSIDPQACKVLLDTLVGMRFLRLTRTGAYVRADDAQ